jgi:hypothetical protein
MLGRLMGVGVVAVFALAATLEAACSSSSGGNPSSESDSGGTPDTSNEIPDASPWCAIDNPNNINGTLDECSRNTGECAIGSTGVASCPTANLAGCCKGTANSPAGPDSEVCIYSDDYLDVEGGAQAWCTCMPPTTGCFGGTWQKSP